jgi:transposase
MSTQKRYPEELRERAVRLVFESGRPVAQVAKDLGVGPESLRSWVRQAEADVGERADRLTSGEREELKHLRGEIKELRRANEILKAASVGHGQRPLVLVLHDLAAPVPACLTTGQLRCAHAPHLHRPQRSHRCPLGPVGAVSSGWVPRPLWMDLAYGSGRSAAA